MSIRLVGCEMTMDQFMNSPGAEVAFPVEVAGRDSDNRVLVIDMETSPHSERFELFEQFSGTVFMNAS